MNGEDVEAPRKTRAILFSDICGYSKRMGEDEAAALRLLEEHNGIVVPLVEARRGRVIKFIGDAVLASFESALDAVEAAIDIQRRLHARNAAKPADGILIRIGIHIGDVVLKEGDAFGDGVNIAARLEPLAEPGGICVSEAVFGMVRARKELRLVDLGERQLKNIAAPMRIFKVLTRTDERVPFAASARGRAFKRWAPLLALPLLIWGAWLGRGLFPSKAPSNKKFTIVAAPFSGEDPESAKEGGLMRELIAQRLTNVLGGGKFLRIVDDVSDAPRSEQEAKALGRKYGAQLVIWGQVASGGGQTLLQPFFTQQNQNSNFQLVKAAGLQTATSDAAYFTALQAKAAEIVDLAALIVGRAYLSDNPALAITFLHHAGRTTDVLVAEGLANSYNGDDARAIELLKQASAADPKSSSAHDGLAQALIHARRVPEAKAELKKAIALDPKFASPHVFLARLLIEENELASADAELQTALSLWPSSIAANMTLGDLNFMRQKWAEAAQAYGATTELAVGGPKIYAQICLALALTRAGETPRAQAALEDLGKTDPAAPWPAPVARFYAGRIDSEKLLKAASALAVATDQKLKCQAYYYLGMAYLLKLPTAPEAKADDAAAKALDAFEKSVSSSRTELVEYRFAAEELTRLKAKR